MKIKLPVFFKKELQQKTNECRRLEGELKNIKDLVKGFFEILEREEVSGPDERVFHPTTIGSCRVLEAQKLEKILKQLKTLSHE